MQGDFNEDGITDLAISNGGDNTVYVLVGNGDGTFKIPEILYTIGQSPAWITAARTRSGGHLDLIVVDGDSQQVELFSGNGDGTFQPSSTIATLAQIPTFVLAGDFNKDGNIDLAIGLAVPPYSIAPQFEVLLGNGSGSFPSSIASPPYDNRGGTFPVPTNWMAAGDLNNDGLTDVVLTVATSAAETFLNQSGNAFQEVGVFGSDVGPPMVVALADMNGDGCLDAVEADIYTRLTIAKGTCDGNFTQADAVAELGDEEAAIAIADVNGDGNLDVVASSAYYPGGVSPDFPDGGPGYGAPGGYLVSVLDGDGKGGVSPAAIYRVGSDAYSLVVADLNGDKFPEIVTVSPDENKATLLLNDGNGGFGKNPGETIGYASDFDVSNAPVPNTQPQTIDLNGDGRPDVLLIEQGINGNEPDQITALLNNGTGTLGPPIRSTISVGPLNPYPLFVAGNFRSATIPDLIYANMYLPTNYLAFFPGNGNGTFGTPTTLATLPQPYQMVSGDFNGDQKLDFAVLGYASATPTSTGELDVFLGNGDGTFKHLPPFTFTPLTAAVPHQFIAGDFNHDGKIDLLIAYGANSDSQDSGDDLDLMLGNGNGTFQAPATLMADFGPVAVGDLNHDGYLDLIQARNPSANITDPSLAYNAEFFGAAITVYLGGPGGAFQPQPSYLLPGVTPGYFTPLVGDFNGDGNLDIALQYLPASSGSRLDYYLQVLQGNGDGTFDMVGSPYQLPVIDQPIIGGDYRGMGVTDLLDLLGFPSSINSIPAAPAPALSMALDPSPLAGNRGTGTVTLALPASSSLSVALSASDPEVNLPPNLTFSSGESQQSFPFTVGSGLDATHAIAFSAMWSGQTATAYLAKSNPNAVPGVTASIGPTSLGENKTMPPVFFPGGTVDFQFILTSVNGYSGTFREFNCTGLPAGASCTFAFSSLPLAAGRSAQVSVAVNTTASIPPGTYTIQVQATDGFTSPSATFVFGIGSFSLNLNPSTMLVNGPYSPGTMVSVAYVGSFSQTVSLSCSGLPSGVQCPATASLNPAISSTSFPLTVNSPGSLAAADYPFQINGSAIGGDQGVSAVLRVTNFTAALDSTTASTASGQVASVNVTLTSLNHFTNNAVAILCQPVGAECIGSASLADGATITVPLKISYEAATTASRQIRKRAEFPWTRIGPWIAVLILPLSFVRRVRGKLLWILVIAAVTSTVSSCSGGNGAASGNGSGSGNQTTTLSVSVYAQATTGEGVLQQPAGTITLTVTN